MIKAVLLIILCCSFLDLFSPLIYAGMDDLTQNLQEHVIELSQNIGERNFIRYESLNRAAEYIERAFQENGYLPESQSYELEGKEYRNIFAVLKGKRAPEEIIVVGAHYDTVIGTPGADDNASGVAGLLELAKFFSGRDLGRTVQFVAFTNEEPPFFRTQEMGSRIFAKEARQKKKKIVAMLCLEMIGYYSGSKGGQGYPLPLMKIMYPDTADFIAVVGNLQSRALVRQVEKGMKSQTGIGVESISTFGWVPGVDFSDHYSFYKEGFSAVMITDTAFYRNSNYHMHSDTANTLDYTSMAHVVLGLRQAILDLAR
jgi:Zn-dependent M28 family amino/carboxypeptidase